MSVRRLKPITPGQRFRVVNNYDMVTASKPEKSLTAPLKKSGGRNNEGKMTMRYRGGGHKRKYRLIDFKRNKFGKALVKSIEYDPNRTAFIALVEYSDGEKRYVIAQSGMQVDTYIHTGMNNVPAEIGNTMPISKIPLGTVISCIELEPGRGVSMVRSAGTFAQLMSREGKFANIKLPSGETRMVLSACMATIGSVSNKDHQLIVSGKAGRKRWLGRRPRTRPVAMNPVDHPMGGGEGRASGGHPRSRKGIPAKGYKTRSVNKKTNRYILESKKNK